MVSMSCGIAIETKMKGGLFGALKRSMLGGLKSTLFSGEGLVCELTGPGKVFIQSRNADVFLSWLIPQLPKRQ